MESLKAIKIWAKLMNAARYTGCHQMPERSFFVCGYQFPVCARCTGVLLGQLISYALVAFRIILNPFLALALLFVMTLDWGIQFLTIKESTNSRRFATGICGGVGITFIFVNIILFCYRLIF